MALIIKKEVTHIAQTYICNQATEDERWLAIVTNMLIALSKEDVPFICKVIIKKSVAAPSSLIDNGGYTVQPVPAPTVLNSPEAYINVK